MRSLAQIKQEIVNDILELRSDVRLVEGDTQYDVVVAAPARQFYRYEVILEFEDRTRNLTEFTNVINDETFKNTFAQVLGYNQDGTPITIADVNVLISARLDAYIQAWNITRSSGNKSTGQVTVYLTTNATVSWDTSTTFTSKQGTEYLATSALSNITPSLNTTLGLYFVTIPVESATTGADINSVAGAVVGVTPAFSNFSYCANASAIDGGTDSETDLDLINRASGVWASRGNGSKQYYDTIAEAESYVDDSLTLDEDIDSESIYLGSVCDSFIQFSSENSEMVTENFYWPGTASNPSAEQFTFTPSNQPMITTVTPIIFRYTLAGAESQITDATITVTEDTNTFSGSVKANNIISIQMILDTSVYQRRVKVLYLYDTNPTMLQQLFDNSDNKLIGPSCLVRKASTVPVRVIAELQTAFGYTASEVETTVTSNISIYFNGGTTSFGRQYARKQIGQDINHTDISDIILRTAGVVSYDRDTFFVINTNTGELTDPISVLSNQYATLLDVLFEFSTYNLSNFDASA